MVTIPWCSKMVKNIIAHVALQFRQYGTLSLLLENLVFHVFFPTLLGEKKKSVLCAVVSI